MGTTGLVLSKVLLINGTIQQKVPDDDGRLLHLDAPMTVKNYTTHNALIRPLIGG